MSTKFYVIAVWTLLSFVVKVNAQDKVECWDRFELSFKQVTKENPFDIRLSATFVCGKEKKTDRKSTRLNSSHRSQSRMPSSA